MVFRPLFQMNQLGSMFMLPIFLILYLVEAQSTLSGQDDQSSSQDAVTNFKPSLAVVIGILAIMFSLTFILLVYAKFCHRATSVHHNNNPQSLDGLIRLGSRFSGIDKTVIESLPFFRFSSLKGSKEGLECAVCLSKFEDVEILRLLPKCKHAFHIDCVDQWLEKHSSCPLCRHKVSSDDLAILKYSNSLRFLWDQPEMMIREDSNLELFVQREEDAHGSSSRFSVGSSFRRLDHKGKKEEELPIQENCDVGDDDDDDEEDQKGLLHKFNHRIIVSDFVLKNRWSNVSSSDLMFLNSEMLGSVSSNRFSSLDPKSGQPVKSRAVEDGEIIRIKEEMERKREFENKVSSKMSPSDAFTRPIPSNGDHNHTSESKSNQIYASRMVNPTDKRSMSEITVHPRFREFGPKNSSRESSASSSSSSHPLPENVAKEERLKRLWLPIARRTVKWFANRERRSQQPQNTRQTLNV